MVPHKPDNQTNYTADWIQSNYIEETKAAKVKAAYKHR